MLNLTAKDALRHQSEIELLLVTANATETGALEGVLKPLKGLADVALTHIENHTYRLGRFGEFNAVHVQCVMGTRSAGSAMSATREAVLCWTPRAVVMTGIAWGNPRGGKIVLGDVLTADSVQDFENTRVGVKKEYRSPETQSGVKLLDRFRSVSDWRAKLPDGRMSSRRIGLLLSGDKVVANAGYRDELLDAFPRAIGGDMESWGVAQACRELDMEWIAVKGVCDWGDENKDDAWQPAAAESSVSLCLAVFSHPSALHGFRKYFAALGKPVEPEPPKEPQRGDWFLAHPYPMPPNFTGRAAERAMLTGWLGEDAAHPLLVLRALGGFGKSALAWHWLLHDVAPAVWPRVVWWSFYEGDSSFDNFLEQTLVYLKAGNPAELGPRQRVAALLQALYRPGTLLVLDGFERLLRAFGGLNAAYQGDDAAGPDANNRDCISPLPETFLRHVATLPDIRAKVLMTTRLRPAPLETHAGFLLQGCREEELIQLQPADAVDFFHAQGIRGTHTEIETACDPYGYHPLSLRLLAGLITSDLQQPGDIGFANRLDVSGDLVARQHHVLEQAYSSLTPVRQKLLSRIACFRSPLKYDALKALAQVPDETTATLDADLRDLIVRGLLHHDTTESRFDLHPIVRHYAYDRLAAPDRVAAHTLLRDYFAAIPRPNKVTRLEDLAPTIEFYHHTVRAGHYDEAAAFFRDSLSKLLYYQLGAYQLRIDLLRALFPDGEHLPPRLKDQTAQAWILNSLANSYAVIGCPRPAATAYQSAMDVAGTGLPKENLAIGLGNLAYMAQIPTGALRAAEANLHRSIALCQELKNESLEAIARLELGRLLAYRGEQADSEKQLKDSQTVFERLGAGRTNYLSVVSGYRAQGQLLRLRSVSASAPHTPQSALQSARRALQLADESTHKRYRDEHDYVRAHWLLGAAHCIASELGDAESHLLKALELCRRINMVDHEADILIDLARLRAKTSPPEEAQQLVEEALLITERSGYVLQGADAHLELAKLALALGDKPGAKQHATKAQHLATCDGLPDYTYKAAYYEASVLIVELEE